MKNLSIVFVLFVFSAILFASDDDNQSLDLLLEQVKKARHNDAIYKLPNGQHWIEGYIESGLFFPCSSKHGLWLIENEHTKSFGQESLLVHIEFTAQFNDGAITILEIHKTMSEVSDMCKFEGGDSGK